MICGKGQVSLLLAVKSLSVELSVEPSVKQDSVTTQLLELWHHPQSSDNKFDADKHDEHTSAKAEQLYNMTINYENKNSYKIAVCKSY